MSNIIVNKEQIERTKYWEEIVKINPFEEVDEEEEWKAYEEYAKEVELTKPKQKEDFVNKIKEIRAKHKLLMGDKQ